MSHSNLAALRGEPSYVWRAGQERRLTMVEQWTTLRDAQVLVDGIGVGMYASQLRRRFTPYVDGIDVELERIQSARDETPHAIVAAAENLPYASHRFDTILSHEVLEHVADDQLTINEMVRVLKVGGRLIIFTPNRWYPFETHGHFWRGEYHFGNTPLINYLPNSLRNKLAPHVRAYTKRGLLSLFRGKSVKLITHRRIYGGYDNIIARLGTPARKIRDLLHATEGTLLDTYGLSHMLVMEKTDGTTF